MTSPIVISRRIAAPREAVYSYLTESAKWARWQGVHAEIEAEPGGIFLMRMPNGSSARGQFVELVPPRRVVFTWGWIDHPGVPPGSSTVEIEITADHGGSVLTLTHSGLPAEEIGIHVLGWEHYLPRLTAVAEGRQVDTDPGPGDQS